MKRLLCLLLLACAFTASAAFPPFTAFIGSNTPTVALLIKSNVTTGKIVFSADVIGSGNASNAIASVSSNGVPVSTAATNLNFAHPAFRLTNDPSGNVNVGLDASVIETPGRFSTNVNSSFSNLFITNMVFVSKGGNDATAQANDLSKTALTLNKAIDLASAGYTIGVFPGTYLQSSNLTRKSGINFEGYGAPTLVLTNISTDRGWGIIEDRFSDMAVTSVLSGFRFLWCGGLPTVDDTTWTYVNSATLGFWVQTNARSRIVVNGVSVHYAGFSAAGGIPSGIYAKDGTNFFNFSEGMFDLYFRSNHIDFDETLADNFDHASTMSGNYWEMGHQSGKAPIIQGGKYAIYGVDAGSGTAPHNMHLEFDQVDGKYYNAGGTNLNWRTWVKCNELINTNGGVTEGAGVEFLGGGRHYLEALKIGSANSYGLFVGSGVEAWVDVQKISAKTKWVSVTGGRLTLKFHELQDLGAIDDGIDLGGGTNFISGLFATVTNTSGNAVQYTGGQTKLVGITLSNSGNTNPVVNVRTNNLTLNNCTIVGATTQFSISTDVDATNHVRLLGCFGTSDITNKLTNAVGTFTVSGFVQ